MKKDNKEVIMVLNIMAASAKKVLKNVKKKDMQPTAQAEQFLRELKARCLDNRAAE